MVPDYEVKPIRNAIVMLTNQCNCRCVYCFEQRSPERMSLETAKDVLRFIHSGGSPRPGLTFFGGEPMLEFDTIIRPLVEWSKAAFPVPTRFAMTTNGTLFNKERLDFLKENNIRFMLSMDGGSTAQTLNRPLANGANSFDAVTEYVPYILELWPNQSFRETLTEYNASSLFEDIQYFISIGCRNLMIVPDIFKMWSPEKIEVLKGELGKYERYLIDGFERHERPFLIHEYMIAFRNLALLEARENEPRRSLPSLRGCYQCGFGVRGSVSIDPKGDIYGCHHISPLTRESLFYLGNVYDGVDTWRVRRLAGTYDQAKVGNEMCAGCGLDAICEGGCAPNNYQINGDVHKVPEMYCVWQRLVMDSAWRVAKALGDSGNSEFQEDFTKSIWEGR